MSLSRDQILAASDLTTETVAVPEWGGDVIVRTISAADRDAFEQSCIQQRGKSSAMNLKNVRAKLVALCCVDGEGNRLFTDQDVNRLGSKSAKALDRIYSVASKLCGLSAEDVEEIAKNSETDPADASLSV